ncbi:hypothetical protein MKZ24_13705 [Paenibacillus sp. FSL R7-0297]|uniref:hypothetical protein n=1 Tax=unclassified Paenibacillus TaxID=185978 RepID=UPI0004F7981A|nr:hypothetical protein [Paenibacillus sp. FSL R5-0912]AIQ42922.1 hypothetical protein R50912_24950 [Paenibacillus sp. FSL R5-0912]
MENELLKEIIVTIGQSIHEHHILYYLDHNDGFKFSEPHLQLDSLDSILKVSEQDGAHFVMLPELFLPRRFLFSHIKERAVRYGSIIMGGLEYRAEPYPSPTGKIRLHNEAFVVIPDNLYQKRKIKNGNATVITIPKLHPAPDEKNLLSGHGFEFINGNRIYQFNSSKLGNFAVLICFDFLNLPVQAILQSQIQTLFVLTYNTDVAGFISIADTMQRMLLCNVVICNTGYYGGSVAFTPLRDRNKRQVFQINGNHIQAAVSVHLPLSEVEKVQETGVTKQGDNKYFHRPPDFGRLASK